MMLGLKDSQGDAACEYESRSVTISQRKPKSGRKGRASGGKSRRNANISKVSGVMAKGSGKKANKVAMAGSVNKRKDVIKTFEEEEPKPKPKREEPIVVEEFLMKEENQPVMKDETSTGLFESPEQNEENSKAFMESLGSWINDLFSAPNKRNLSPKNEKEVLNKEVASMEDAEYLKSINAITEQFKKKLKNETTVHVSVPETPFELNFDNILDNPKKLKKRAKTQPVKANSDWLAEFNGSFNVPTSCLSRHHCTDPHATALVIRTADAEESLKPYRTKNSLELNSTDLLREKKRGKNKPQNRHPVGELDDYILPRTAELSKKILLNVNEQDKFVQFYKNTHLAAQDYGQRKSKTYQSNTRCYTTKAKGRGKFSPGSYSSANRASHYSTPAILPKSLGDVLSKNPPDYKIKSFRNVSRKAVSELSRDSMSFSKMKSGGPFPTIQDSRSRAKASSDDLVKYLMKKIKSTRPRLAKKKGRTKVPQILAGVKNRFMQSATNSLVRTVLAKKDNESHLNSKSSARLFMDSKIHPGRELMLKESNTAMRLDLARAMHGNKFTKCSYLLEDDRASEGNLFPEKCGRKSLKQSYEEVLKREFSKNEKFTKRQEVKRMLSNLDMKEVFQTSKAQSKKEQIKNQTPPEELPVEVDGEWQNPRFQKQHELFKRSLKTAQGTEAEDKEEIDQKDMDQNSKEDVSSSTENEVPGAISHLLPHQEQKMTEEADEGPEPHSITFPDRNQNRREAETFCKEKEKLLYMKAEKKTPEKSSREKECRVKSLSKATDSKSLMNPLMDLCNDENQAQRDSPRSYGVCIPPKEFRAVKGTESFLVNRRYSTNLVEKAVNLSKHVILNSQKTALYFLELDKEKEKKEEKKDKCSKDNKSPAAKTNDNQCGFEKEKVKPGPDCSKES